MNAIQILAAQAWVEHPKFPAPWPAACALSKPALDSPTDQFAVVIAVVNSPARRFLAAIMLQPAVQMFFVF